MTTPVVILSIIFGALTLCTWIAFHYMTKWKQAKSLSGDEEQMLEDMWENATRLEQRIKTLENILDAEQPDWRSRHEPT